MADALPPLLRRVRRGLTAAADPARAPAMQAYMKSAMPYHGVSAPALRRVCREAFAGLSFASARDFRGAVLGLWRAARFREERHAAIELSGQRRFRAFQDLAALPMYEEMIVTGAWWDYVDVLATHRLGDLLRAHPASMARTLRGWSRGRDLWKRRSAILAQLHFKQDTDLPLLYSCIEPSLASKEFFLRKAIGWALRQYAWTDPAEVRRYVRANEGHLSPLSRREALKNLGRRRNIGESPRAVGG
jgi:3-methyladenine DNA glycosylase AlkD